MKYYILIFVSLVLLLYSQSLIAQENLVRTVRVSAPEMELIDKMILRDLIIPIAHYSDSIKADKSLYQKFLFSIYGEVVKELDGGFVAGGRCTRFNDNFIGETNSPIVPKGIYLYGGNLFLLEGNMIDKYFKIMPRKITVTFNQGPDDKIGFDYSSFDYWSFFRGEDGMVIWECYLNGYESEMFY
ncbi:MAG: hypothetical protein NC095_11505 [Muribaculum sp.]|nr:hypothetical protein [Muribaculum sp.]